MGYIDGKSAGTMYTWDVQLASASSIGRLHELLNTSCDSGNIGLFQQRGSSAYLESYCQASSRRGPGSFDR